jgi:streptomycin 6-kinase
MTLAVDDATARRCVDVVAQWNPAARVRDVVDLGGHSGLTLAARLEGGAAPDRIVLKLAPEGRPSTGRHDVVRQARLLQALEAAPGVCVPQILFVDEHPPPAVGFTWVEGEAYEPILDEGERPASTVSRRARALARMLAALHRASPSSLGVSVDEQKFSGREDVERWTATMNTVEPALRTGADELCSRLLASVPPPLPATVIHGDARLGNALCQDERVEAIIDWEIWSLADPRIDLGWFLCFTTPEDMPGNAHPAPSMPSYGELLDEYVAERGSPIPDIAWFDAAARYKMAAIMGNNLRRHRQGRRHDPYQERLVATIPRLIDAGLEHLERLGA